MDDLERVLLALVAFESFRTPAKIAGALREGGASELRSALAALAVESRDAVEERAARLVDAGVRATFAGDDVYPDALLPMSRSMPVLFYRGNRRLFEVDGVGMCGSRDVSDAGLNAARTCGFEVSRRRLVVVSGYAKGVDTQTHLAALKSGGSTVIVLAEGIEHFRVKRDFKADFDSERTLIVSQFAPGQPWSAHAAMARNAIIWGLGRALVVIEAGERGGTLAAGQGALKAGRPVAVLDFGDRTPAGNRILLDAGGRAVRTPAELGGLLDRLKDRSERHHEQGALF